MTPKEIDLLQPGADLDALIAEHIMGWKKVDPKPEDYQQLPGDIWRSESGMECLLPLFSVHINAAWIIFEKVVEQVGSGMVWKWPESHSGYGCEFDKDPPIMRTPGLPIERIFMPGNYHLRPARMPEFYASGLSAPLSICRAALKFGFRKNETPCNSEHS